MLPWREQYLRAKAGDLPAEALPSVLRRQLFMQLHGRGWSVEQIADWTRTDSVVVLRILDEGGVDR